VARLISGGEHSTIRPARHGLYAREGTERRQADLDGQDVSGRTGEAICGPPLDLMPEGRGFSFHIHGWSEGIPTVAEDGE